MNKSFFDGLGVLPVVVLKNIVDTIPTLSALKAGGINAAEITFRTDCAADAIALGRAEFPDMLIGAGTVITKKQAELAVECGAEFVVSPGLSADIAVYLQEKDIPYLPGCVTPTEIMAALELGITTVKFFPAGVYGGIDALKSLSGPFPQVKFVPTGGIGLDDLKDFLALPCVAAVGGSFMMKGDITADCLRITEMLK